MRLMAAAWRYVLFLRICPPIDLTEFAGHPADLAESHAAAASGAVPSHGSLQL